MNELADDHQLAAELADEAGALLLTIRSEGGAVGDRRSNDLLLERLAQARPNDAVLSEESADGPARLECRRVWIIDPLDGTREYSEAPRKDWAVHVALAIEGEARVGAVALPAQGVVFSTGSPRKSGASKPDTIRIAVSRTRPPEGIDQLVDALGAILVPMGSAGAKAMAVVSGEADLYVHSGGQYEWDSCAPVAVAAAAGLHTSRTDGSSLRYNQPNPYLPDLLICRPDLAQIVIETLSSGREPKPLSAS